MGTRTHDQMVTNVRFMLQNPTDNRLTDSNISQLVNDSYRHVCRPKIYEHKDLMSEQDITLTSVQSYNLNSDVQAIRHVTDTDRGFNLKPRQLEWIDGRILTSGAVSAWARDGGEIIFDRTPSSAYQGNTIRVRYWAKPDAISSTETTVIDDDWDEIIEQGAVWRGWNRLGDRDRAREAADIFVAMIREIAPQAVLEAEGDNHSFGVSIFNSMRTR